MRSKPAPYLIVCTAGARHAGIFEQHEAWTEFQDNIVYPGHAEQDRLQEAIYQTKSNGSVSVLAEAVKKAAANAQAKTVVFTCTELHLLHSYYNPSQTNGPPFDIVDPLLHLAEKIDHFLGVD